MMNKKQTVSIVILFVLCTGIVFALLAGARHIIREGMTDSASTENAEDGQRMEEEVDETGGDDGDIPPSVIHAEGKTLETRVSVPEGYHRTRAGKDSLEAFLREYPLKKDGSPVRCYNGKKKTNQNAHAAVFRLPIEEEDLQQCADSIMRVYAEYYWSIGHYDKIAFHFVDGFLAQYSKWRQGYRIQTGNSGTSWVKSASEDSSYEAFQKYMRIVFSYAGTLSMEEESSPIRLSKIRTGDILIKGGSPGHVVMVVDVCKKKDGGKAFLLAQGYMPAQEFHLLKNPLHEEDPWYYQEEVAWPLVTPEYTFQKGSLMRPAYQ